MNQFLFYVYEKVLYGFLYDLLPSYCSSAFIPKAFTSIFIKNDLQGHMLFSFKYTVIVVSSISEDLNGEKTILSLNLLNCGAC